MSSPKQPAVTTQINETKLPAWVEAGSQENYAYAKDVANRPLVQYGGDRVAELSDMEKAAGGILQGGMDRTNTNLDMSSFMAQQAGNYKPQQVGGGMSTVPTVANPAGVADVTAGGFLSRNINDYMNPYTGSVVDTTLGGMRDQLDLSAVKNSDAARAAGAFGGSRHGVTEGVLRAEGAKGMAATEANLRDAAYKDAAGRIQTDNQTALQAALANQNAGLTTNAQTLTAQQANQASTNTQNAQTLAAQTSNQGAGLQAAQLGLTGAGILSGNATAASDTAGRNAILSQQLGASERGIEQAKLDQQYASFMEQRDYPLEQLNTRLAALGMSPYGKTTSSTGTSQSQSSSNPWMTGIGAAATILPMLFSDREVKKNIKKVGKTENDLNVYEYDYKKSFMGADTPKQIGLMADDVKKKVPGAVHTTNRKFKGKKVKAVDYGRAMGSSGFMSAGA